MTARQPVRVPRALLLVALLIPAGCAHAGPSAVASSSPSSSPPRPPCARPGDDVRFVEVDAIQVTMLHIGTGPRGVALLPQSDGDVCQFADLAHRLATAGYQVATFGPWSSPYSHPVEAAYRALLDAGARRLVLLGASQGAAMALATAATLTPTPAGVIALSAESSTDDGSSVLAGVAAYRGPLLIAGTQDDMYAPGGVTRQLAKLHPGAEEVHLFPGNEHGIELLPRLTAPIDAFLARTLPP